MLVDAFIQEFGNIPQVKLTIHSVCDSASIAETIHKKMEKQGINNIELHIESLPWAQYIQFMSSLDCYVLVSKGEGFSVTPREALALGIPCIISNNTAHKTLCQSGYVHGVNSDIKEKHEGEFYGVSCGSHFNCTIEDVRKALRDVYENYTQYLAKAHLGREWVKCYRGENLKPYYMSLFKPRKVLLGDEDVITPDFLMTTESSLYQKYVSLSR